MQCLRAMALAALPSLGVGTAEAASFERCNTGAEELRVAAAHRSSEQGEVTSLGWLPLRPGTCTTVASNRRDWLDIHFAVRVRRDGAWVLNRYRFPEASRTESVLQPAERFLCFPDADFSFRSASKSHAATSCDARNQKLANNRLTVIGDRNFKLNLN